MVKESQKSTLITRLTNNTILFLFLFFQFRPSNIIVEYYCCVPQCQK
jgi:hypothetical protein